MFTLKDIFGKKRELAPKIHIHEKTFIPATIEQLIFLKHQKQNELHRKIRKTEEAFSTANQGKAILRAQKLENELAELYAKLMLEWRKNNN